MALKTEQKTIPLTHIEEQVYQLVKRKLGKRRVFMLDDSLIDYCMGKVKAPEVEIYRAIYSLMRQKIIVPGSHLTREQILDNENRNLIFNTLQNSPGIHIRELTSKLNITSSVVRVHLKVLESFGFIRRQKFEIPKMVLLFPKEFPDTYDQYFLLWKNENTRQIIKHLINNHSNLTELSSKLGVHHSTIQYHIEKLEHLNIVTRIETNRHPKFTFNKGILDTFIDFLELIS